MTFLELLTKYLGLALPNTPSVADVLKAIEAKFPDSKPLLDVALAGLAAPIDVAALAAAIPPELLSALKGRIDQRYHSGDAI